ncbi:hypothetical protein [Massilia rhizosphaerae]|uniref:hypothetical protein n=1 Tax=Massilia rhizosphaerae TaxID=2784389 RepID=UPI0018DBB89B|nr:hypothetical protein [Massilia rhizosphaerae]
MITTDDTNEMSSHFVQPSIRTWRTATLDFATLYIFINHAFRIKRNWLYQTAILWQYDDVLNFCQDFKNDKSRKIVDIWLLEPLFEGAIRTRRWTTVLEIKKYFEEPGPAIPVYFTDAGEAVGLTDEESQRDMEVIYTRRK